MEIKKPKYPFILEIRHIVKSGNPTPIIKIVKSESEYTSVTNNYCKGFSITERKLKWHELKGYNFFFKLYYLTPPIILWLIGFAIGGLTLKEILPYIMQLKK